MSQNKRRSFGGVSASEPKSAPPVEPKLEPRNLTRERLAVKLTRERANEMVR